MATKLTKRQQSETYRPLKRPDFESQQLNARTVWPNRAILSDADFADLLKLIPVRFGEAKRVAFLMDMQVRAQIVLKRKRQAAAQTTQAALRKVETKARALLQAMALVDADMDSFLKACAVDMLFSLDGDERPFFLDRAAREISIAAHFWDAVQEVEKTANAARILVAPQKGKADKDAISKALVILAAQAHESHFNKVPPVSAGAWFARWVADFGKAAGHPFSAKQAESALRTYLNK